MQGPDDATWKCGGVKSMEQVLINWHGDQMMSTSSELRKGDGITPYCLSLDILQDPAVSFTCHLLWSAFSPTFYFVTFLHRI